MTDLKWITEKRKIKDLKLFEGNPRKMTEIEAENLMSSLKKFNLAEIPAIDTKDRILAGNMRITALKKLGRGDEEIEVRVPNRELTEEEAREYLLRSNRNTGQWDFDLLANFGEDELMTSGFESEEIDQVFLGDATEDDFDAESEYAKIKETSVKIGDLYQLGNHRLGCLDATKREDVEKLMGGERADMVFTDPPYGINIVKVGGGGKTKFGKVGGGKWVSANYYRPVIGDDVDFNPQFLLDLAEKILIFGGNYFSNLLPNSRCWLCWDKTGENYIQNNFADCEYIWTNLQKPSRVYRCKWRGLIKEKGEDIKKRIHPTQKPIKLLSDILEDYTEREEKILDLFGGSGSILIACQQLNRKCFMMEIDERYCQVILNRFEKFTGLKAIKI